MGTVIDRLFHRRNDGATTVPEVLEGWPSAPSGACDICGEGMSSVGTHRVSATEFRGIMRKGYDPFATGRAPRTYMLMGVSRDDAYAGWRVLVERDTSDWGLCQDCADEVATFVVAN